MVQPCLWGTSPPQVDLPALTHGAGLLLSHRRVSLGQRDCLAAARDFAFSLFAF